MKTRPHDPTPTIPDSQHADLVRLAHELAERDDLGADLFRPVVRGSLITSIRDGLAELGGFHALD